MYPTTKAIIQNLINSEPFFGKNLRKRIKYIRIVTKSPNSIVSPALNAEITMDEFLKYGFKEEIIL